MANEYPYFNDDDENPHRVREMSWQLLEEHAANDHVDQVAITSAAKAEIRRREAEQWAERRLAESKYQARRDVQQRRHESRIADLQVETTKEISGSQTKIALASMWAAIASAAVALGLLVVAVVQAIAG